MKKHFARLMCLVTIIIFCEINSGVALAATYGNPDSGRYTIVGNSTNDGKDHHLYKSTSTWRNYYKDSPLNSIGLEHVEGRNTISLSITETRSFSTTSTVSWSVNASLTSTYGVDLEVFKRSVAFSTSLGVGGSIAYGASFTKSATVVSSVPANAPTGSYYLTPGWKSYKMKDIVVSTTSGASDTYYYFTPFTKMVAFTTYYDNSGNFNFYA